MSIVKYIYNIIHNFSLIIFISKNQTAQSKKELFLTYFRLILKYLLLIKILKLNISN